MLARDPKQRIDAEGALRHLWFQSREHHKKLSFDMTSSERSYDLDLSDQ